jgi:hypothetical protein
MYARYVKTTIIVKKGNLGRSEFVIIPRLPLLLRWDLPVAFPHHFMLAAFFFGCKTLPRSIGRYYAYS